MEKDVILISISKSEFKEIIKSTLLEIHEPTSQQSDEAPISQQEAMMLLNCSAPTILKWRLAGHIPYEKPFPTSRKVRYYKSQLKQAMLQNPHLLKKKF